MKNVKNLLATALVAVLLFAVSASASGGIVMSDKANCGNTGIVMSDYTGIVMSDFTSTGIVMSGIISAAIDSISSNSDVKGACGDTGIVMSDRTGIVMSD